MESIFVLEKFSSKQGEGYYTGTDSIFVRSFGCNFQCTGFGMPAGERSEQALYVIPLTAIITKLDELPLVSTGCDSYAAHMKEFKYLSTEMTVEQLIGNILELHNDQTHLVLTGGEPLLKRQQLFYSKMLLDPRLDRFTHITFETNGTQTLTPELAETISSSNKKFIFSVSPKLSNSGESRKRAIKPDAIYSYYKTNHMVYLKFVVQAESDADEIDDVLLEYYNNGVPPLRVYFMPCGGTVEEYRKYKELVRGIAEQHSHVSFSERLHLDLYGNAWST